jgi:hypothetical protein
LDERGQRDSEKRGNPDILNPGFITQRVEVSDVDPREATGVQPSEADPFASDRVPVSGANLKNTTSLLASATPSYMGR